MGKRETKRGRASCASLIPITTTGDAKALKIDLLVDRIGWSSTLKKALMPLDAQTNLAVSFEQFTAKIRKIEADQTARQNVLNDELLKANVNYYSTEQEADELSAEWLSRLGIDPASMITAMLEFLKLDEKTHPLAHGEFQAARCEALYKNQWRDENGNPVFVPVANWNDPHHSSCFRAFNISREIDIHGLSNHGANTRPTPVGAVWDEIKKAI